MKLSVSTYSFQKLLKNGTMTQLDCISKAKSMGFEGIEFAGLSVPENSHEEEYAKLLSEECNKEQITASCFSIGADFLLGSNGDTRREIERVKQQVNLAEMLGVSLMRHDATRGDGRGFDTVLPILTEACTEITEYAAAKGIRTMVENHGYFCQDSERVEKLYQAVNHPNFGLLTDMGNFLCVDEPPEQAVARVAPNTFYAHAKDFHVKSAMLPNPGQGFFRSRGGNYLRGAIIGHGDVPVMQCLWILKNSGYDGWLAIEFEGMENPLEAIPVGQTNLKNYLSAI